MNYYTKKSHKFITAVQLNLDTEGFNYEKWGSTQKCKAGDWLVNNDGETYTIDKESFENTYRYISPGVYVKPCVVWAKLALEDGWMNTKEGMTEYTKGDMVVYNDEALTDGYAMSFEKFDSMYE